MTQDEKLSAKDDLLARLNEPAVRDEVKGWSESVLGSAVKIYSCPNFGHKTEAVLELKWRYSLQSGYELHGYAPEAFAGVVTRLPEPCIVTAKELEDAFRVYIEAADERLCTNFDQLYQGYLDHVRLRILTERRSPPLALCELWGIDDKSYAMIAALKAENTALNHLADPQLDALSKVAALWERIEALEKQLALSGKTDLDAALGNATKIASLEARIAALKAREAELSGTTDAAPPFDAAAKIPSLEARIASLKAQLASHSDTAEPDWRSDFVWTMGTKVALARGAISGETPQLPPPPTKNLLWAQNGLTLREIPPVPCVLGIREKQHGTLFGQLSGAMSEGALARLAEELEPALRAILRSVSLLRPPSDDALYFFANAGLPNLLPAELQEYQVFINECASVLFLTPDKKDAMARRFANAVRLLSEADGQTTPAIRLALSMTAIEALLGLKEDIKTGVVAALAQRTSVLLEPDPSHRCKARKLVRDLYNSRSRTLHGDNLVADVTEAEQVRALAAGCLYGLWCSYQQALIEEPPDSPESFLRELGTSELQGRRPAGSPDLPGVYALWRKAATPEGGVAGGAQ